MARAEPPVVTRKNLRNLRILAVGVVIVSVFVIATQLGLFGGKKGDAQLIVIMGLLLAGAVFVIVKIGQALRRDDLP